MSPDQLGILGRCVFARPSTGLCRRVSVPKLMASLPSEPVVPAARESHRGGQWDFQSCEDRKAGPGETFRIGHANPE